MSADFATVWGPIWDKNPVLKTLMERYGDRSVYEYLTSFLENSTSTSPQRQEEWLSVFGSLLEERLGGDVAKEVTDQLRNLPLVSTADHHAPLDEAYWVNTNLVHSLAQQHVQNRYCVALSFASISLNTALGYPRGLLLHDYSLLKDGARSYRFYPEEKLLRLSYFGDKDKMSVVYGFRAFQQEDFERFLNAIQLRIKERTLAEEKADALREWGKRFLLDPEFLKQKDYSNQITVLNYKIWPSFFANSESPRVIYLEIETLVNKLLQEFHFNRVESPLYKLMFTPEGRAAFVKYFEGVHGAFCAHENDGTYFFWGLVDKGHRVRLFLQEDCLHSETKDICINLDPEAFSKAIRDGKLFPSMALCYITMAFYYGLRCLGGSSQIRDLERTQNSWMNVLNAMGFPQEADSIAKLPTHDLVGSLGLSFDSFSSPATVLPTGLDLALSAEKKPFEFYKNRAQKLTVSKALSLYLKDLYIDYCRDIPFPLQDLPVSLD